MAYSSPLHLLESLDLNPEELSAEGITRVRKKLLADFNLSGQVTLKIKDKEYSKDEILKTIDKLKEVDNLSFHLEIFNNKKILNWIEKPNSNDFFKYDFIGFLRGKETEPFFGDTVGDSLYEFVFQNVKKRKFKHTGDILPILNSLTFSDKNKYLEKLHAELEYIIEEFKLRLDISNVPNDKKEYRFITEPEWTDFLNNLPEGFEELRNEYCTAAINYTSVIYKHFNEFAYNINIMLLQTECDSNLEEIINKNHRVFEQNGNYSSVSSSEGGTWQYVKVFIWVIIILARVVACSNH